MIEVKPDVEPLGFYTQQQAAKALGVCRHTIKRYETEGIMKFFVRKANGRKVTKGSEIIKIWNGLF